jgi:hypothetical protein
MKKIVVFLSVVSLIWILLLSASCQKEPTGQSQLLENPECKLNVVWMRLFHSDTLREFILMPCFWQNYVIYSSGIDMDNGRWRTIRVLHKLNGTPHPAWTDEGRPLVQKYNFISDFHVGGTSGNDIILGNYNHYYSYNLNTGLLNAKLDFTQQHLCSDVRFAMMRGNPLLIYYPFTGYISNSWVKLAQYNAENLVGKDILQINKIGNYDLFLHPPAWYVNMQGDTLLFFTVTDLDFDTKISKVRAYCYNMTRKDTVWKRDPIGLKIDEGTSNVPTIMANSLIIRCIRSVQCLDLITGNTKWQLPYYTTKTNLLPWNDRLYMRTFDGNIYCIDPETGSAIWSIEGKDIFPGLSQSNMAIYKNRLYLTGMYEDKGFRLFCIDINTGTILWHDAGPHSTLALGVIIDQQTGYLYTSNSVDMLYCFDLNKSHLE